MCIWIDGAISYAVHLDGDMQRLSIIIALTRNIAGEPSYEFEHAASTQQLDYVKFFAASLRYANKGSPLHGFVGNAETDPAKLQNFALTGLSKSQGQTMLISRMPLGHMHRPQVVYILE